MHQRNYLHGCAAVRARIARPHVVKVTSAITERATALQASLKRAPDAQADRCRDGAVLQTPAALTKQFGGITAANDAPLSVEKGARHALIGPNGAGQDTVISIY